MRTITQGELRITGDACFGAVEKAQLHQAFGEHGTLEALVWLKAGTEGNDGDMRWNGLPVCLMASGKKDDFLFSGVVRRAAFVRINGRRAVELTADSYTYLLDREKRTRTFQQESRTYRKFAEMLMSRVRGACIWNGEGGNDAVGSFLMQYMESDWEFLRRVASMQGQPLIPEVRWAGARVYIGLMDSGEVKTLEAGEYRIRKTLAKIPGQEDNVGKGYLCGNRELQVWDRYEEYEPGERVSVNGSILTVAEKTSYIKNSQWLNSYGFMESRACRTETIKNPRPSGVAVRGSVIEADMDRSRMQLVTDGFGENPESMHLCPVYYAGSGKGYSGQPEKGDIQYLYFPTGQDTDRYVIGCVDAGTEKMEQLGRQEGDENVGLASGAESAGGELSEVKRWNTPGNRRMVLSRGGVSFTNSQKGGLNVRSGGIRVWTDGNMTLGAEKIAGDGQKITADAGDYVWLGSGSGGMLLLPDQVQISAIDVYMESPLNWIHKTDEEKSPETLLMEYERKKGTVPPITAPDGSIIRRDGYDEILYSEEMYEYFINNVINKVEGYGTEHGEPIPTLYEMWLDTNYGRSKLGQFWDYCSDIDNIQTALDIGGFVWDGFDVMNAVLYALQGEWEQAAWSSVAMIPIAGSAIKSGAKAGKKALSAAGNLAPVVKAKKRITSLKITFRITEEGAGFLEQIRKIWDDICRKMNHSQCYVEIPGVGWVLVDDAELLLKDSTGNVTEILKMGNGAADAVSDGRKVAKGVGAGGNGLSLGELINKIPNKYKKKFQCFEFSDEMERLMKENKIVGEKVFVESKSKRIWSYKFDVISTNGKHRAIKIGDTIYDNLNPAGIKYEEWLYDLGIKEIPSEFSIKTEPIN